MTVVEPKHVKVVADWYEANHHLMREQFWSQGLGITPPVNRLTLSRRAAFLIARNEEISMASLDPDLSAFKVVSSASNPSFFRSFICGMLYSIPWILSGVAVAVFVWGVWYLIRH